MKRLYVICMCFASMVVTMQLCMEPERSAADMTQEGYKLIDVLFEHAHQSIAAKENIMTVQWLSNQAEIKEIQNLLSDSTIIFTFDQNSKNPLPELLAAHVQQKIVEHAAALFILEEISAKRVQDFYEFSHTLCKLSGGSHCGRFMRRIENDHFYDVLKLEFQKKALQQKRKEDAQQLRDALVLGTRKR